MTEQQKPVLAVVGPTASGKTALGVQLAKSLGGRIGKMAEQRSGFCGFHADLSRVGSCNGKANRGGNAGCSASSNQSDSKRDTV